MTLPNTLLLLGLFVLFARSNIIAQTTIVPPPAHAQSAPKMESGQILRADGSHPTPRLQLTPTVFFEMTTQPGSDRLFYELSAETESGKKSLTDGEGVGRDETYICLWDQNTRTLWIATPTRIRRISFDEGLHDTKSWVTTPPGGHCGQGEIPPAFQEAITQLSSSTK